MNPMILYLPRIILLLLLVVLTLCDWAAVSKFNQMIQVQKDTIHTLEQQLRSLGVLPVHCVSGCKEEGQK